MEIFDLIMLKMYDVRFGSIKNNIIRNVRSYSMRGGLCAAFGRPSPQDLMIHRWHC